MKDDAWGVQDEWENEAQTKGKKKHLKQNATKQKEHDINLGMT